MLFPVVYVFPIRILYSAFPDLFIYLFIISSYTGYTKIYLYTFSITITVTWASTSSGIVWVWCTKHEMR